MRSIWKGDISFGLVTVPVKLYSATADHDIHLHQVHDADGGRIRYERRCEVCGKVVAYEHIDKAFEDGDRTVVLTEDDIETLPEERSREIEVVEFVPSDQVDPIMFDRSYFLEPASTTAKAYVLLRRTLEDTDRTAIVHFSLRQKTRLGALRVHGDVLMLQSLLWDDEVREADFPALRESVRISAKEREMSAALVDQYASEFRPDAFTDEYQAELRTLIDAKLEHGEGVETEATFGESVEEDSGGEVLDLMEALRRSVARSRGTDSEPTAGSPKGSTPTRTRKKTPTKKASEKAASEKASSKKASKKKSEKASPKSTSTTKSAPRKSAAKSA